MCYEVVAAHLSWVEKPVSSVKGTHGEPKGSPDGPQALPHFGSYLAALQALLSKVSDPNLLAWASRRRWTAFVRFFELFL